MTSKIITFEQALGIFNRHYFAYPVKYNHVWYGLAHRDAAHELCFTHQKLFKLDKFVDNTSDSNCKTIAYIRSARLHGPKGHSGWILPAPYEIDAVAYELTTSPYFS